MSAMSKVHASASDAVADIGPGSRVSVGGFGINGIPSVLIDALLAQGADRLHVVSNNCGLDGVGLGVLLNAGRIASITASYVGENKEFARQYLQGEIRVELTPQGTLAEKLRAGGAGIPAFYTPSGVGTVVADGGLPLRYDSAGAVVEGSQPKEVRTFGGREYILEESITTDFGLIRAAVVDTDGNCVFNKAARNFNPLAAMAAHVGIVEAERLVPAGEIDPDHVHLPGIFIQRIVELTPEQAAAKGIERRTVRTPGDA
jgi:3-oxoacid CoA-transferase subunit A